MEKLLERINKRKVKIGVFGDGLVDEYYFTEVNRINPEHPSVIYSSKTAEPSKICCGGALNVACQFKHFNADVKFMGFLDADAAGLAKHNGIELLCHRIDYGINPVKRRLYSGQHLLCRWDIEQPLFGFTPDELKRRQDEYLRDCLTPFPKFDVIILSEYSKGTFANGFLETILELTQDQITIVDPKKGPFSRYKNCCIIKPNATEAKELTGEDDWHKQCDKIYDETGCTAVVITCGDNGVVGCLNGQYFEYRPDKKVFAESTIGAGDAFVAVLALGLAHNLDLLEIIEIAFRAGSIYVQRKFNEPVTLEELFPSKCLQSKIVSFEELKTLKKGRVVWTNGTYDMGLSAGHVQYLNYAKAKGDTLIVAVNSDESVSRIKGPNGPNRPIVPLKERMQVLAALECVDYVTWFDEDTPEKLIRELMPDLVIKGGDYKIEDVVGYGIVDVEVTPLFDSLSTSEKLKRYTENVR